MMERQHALACHTDTGGKCNCGLQNRIDAERYRKLRASPHWTLYDIVWDEAYLGIVAAQGDALDAAVDAMPNPLNR